MSELKRQGISALIWDFLGKLSSQGVGFIVTIILARLLEPSDFGLIAMIMVVVGIAQVFTDIGLGGALIQKQDVEHIHYSSVFCFNMLTAICLTTITFLSAGEIANFYGNEQLVPLIEVISVLFILSALSSVQAIKLRKNLKYALISKVAFSAASTSGVVGVICAYNGAGVWSLVAQLLSFSICNSIILWLSSGWRPSLVLSYTALQQLWSFGFRLFLSRALEAIFSRIDYLVIGKLFSADTLGYFQRAKQFNLLVIQYTSGSLMSVMFPVLSKIQDDLSRFQNVVINTFYVLCFIVFFLLGGLYLVSEELVVFLYSEKWLPSVNYMQLLLLSAFAYPLSSLLINVFTSRGNSKLLLRLEVLKKLIHSLNLVCAFYYGLETYLYGLAIVALVTLTLNVFFATKEMEVPATVLYLPFISQLSLCLSSVTVTLLLSRYLDHGYLIDFLFKGSFFVVIFVLLNFIFKTKSFDAVSKQIEPLIVKYLWKTNERH